MPNKDHIHYILIYSLSKTLNLPGKCIKDSWSAAFGLAKSVRGWV